MKRSTRKRRKNRRSEAKPVGRDLTVKERRLLHNLASGMNRHQAAIAAGYSNPATAYLKMHKDGYGTDRGANFRAHYLALMDAMGLTDEAILQPVEDGLKAKVPKWNAERKRWDHFTDHPTRLHAADMGLKLRGRYPPVDQRGPVVAVHVETNLTDPAIESEAFEVVGTAEPGSGDSNQLEQQ